jgi:Smg protein
VADRDDHVDEGLAALLAELRARFRSVRDPRAVRVYLESCGYDGQRLDAVLEAFAAELGTSEDVPTPAPRPTHTDAPPPIRVAAAHERVRFLPAAWGYLLQRRAAAGWSVAELENVIERALIHIDGRIGVDDLRALLDGAAGGSAPSSTLH